MGRRSLAQTLYHLAVKDLFLKGHSLMLRRASCLGPRRNDFVEIIEMLDKRLNDKGKNWRHVFKSLTLLDYMLHSGSENVVMYFR